MREKVTQVCKFTVNQASFCTGAKDADAEHGNHHSKHIRQLTLCRWLREGKNSLPCVLDTDWPIIRDWTLHALFYLSAALLKDASIR